MAFLETQILPFLAQPVIDIVIDMYLTSSMRFRRKALLVYVRDLELDETDSSDLAHRLVFEHSIRPLHRRRLHDP